MSEQQKTRTIDIDEWESMSEAEQNVILKSPVLKMEGTAVVRKADGTIRYDNDAEPGDYQEKGEGNG